MASAYRIESNGRLEGSLGEEGGHAVVQSPHTAALVDGANGVHRTRVHFGVELHGGFCHVKRHGSENFSCATESTGNKGTPSCGKRGRKGRRKGSSKAKRTQAERERKTRRLERKKRALKRAKRETVTHPSFAS